ncbi:MAG: hydantoinase/oxoprolinase family protein, partial [Gammaproteobacteria bacterium]|nr:hydantoinase/oxoprolinase family protein [Gammaproteobacteria bacterium]
MSLSDFNPDTIHTLLAVLKNEAPTFVCSCDPTAPIQAAYKAYMRYTGQGEEIPIVLSLEVVNNPSAERFQQLFEADYHTLFGRTVEGMSIEITVWSVNATTLKDKVEAVDAPPETSTPATNTKRSLFDSALGRPVDAAAFQRHDLSAGSIVNG